MAERTRADVVIEIEAYSGAIREGAKKVVFHSGGTRREVEYHSLNDMIMFRRSLYAELAKIDGRSAIVLAAT